MKKKRYHKPKFISANRIGTIESIQLAGVSPRAVLFIKEKLNQK